jgi:hypothetical protein
VLSPQLAPNSFQVTPLFCESFCTVAVKFWLAFVGTVADIGDTVTTIAPGLGITVTVAAADFMLSATDVAVRVTIGGEGTLAGAVYVTGVPDGVKVAESAPQLGPLQPTPLSSQERLYCDRRSSPLR